MVERQLAELRGRVAKLERTVAFLEKHLGVTFTDVGPVGVLPEVVALVRAGDKLSAIRVHCQRTGASLKDAKALIDSIE